MSKKLFVGSLDWGVSDRDLEDLFAQYGEVLESKVILDRDTGRSRGFGFVTLAQPDQAEEALRELDGAEFKGRRIRVNEANERAPRGGGGGGGGREAPRGGRGSGRGGRW